MNKAFSLIELLVVISIIGVLLALSIFGISNSRESARDAKRKADLELIRSGLEIYRADCDEYPSAIVSGSPLKGDNTPTSCVATNEYISLVPNDPLDTARKYSYTSNGITYTLCAALEKASGSVTGCGSCSVTGAVALPCNYKVINP